MTKPLHSLIVEDSEDDTELLLRELRRGGYDPVHARVETYDAMSAELSSHQWDIVFSDFTMPQFNAFDALALLRSTGQDIPFIIVSGTIGEDRAVTAMKAGAHDYILKDNIKRLLPAVERELREARVRQEARAAEQTIRRLAYVDSVTDLPNRARFKEMVQTAVSAGRDAGTRSAILIVDLARFREVNEALGHSGGDHLLQQVGLRLRSTLFKSDVIARLGADEFGVYLQNLTDEADIEVVISKLQDILQAPFMIDGIPIAVEASVGVAFSPEHSTDAESLIQFAGTAMFRAKNLAAGLAIYEPEYDAPSPERLRLMAELRDAIEKNELSLCFQPIVEIATHKCIGAEALVRWRNPRRGRLDPDTFILPAEQTGLIEPITRWILHTALDECQLALRQGTLLCVNINLSARSLHNPRLPGTIEELLHTTGAPPGSLTLEITESAIIPDPRGARETLMALHGLGVHISIDDFGTGYTSLASLSRLPVSEIKVDKSFVKGMLANRSDAMIVHSIVDLGHNLGLTVVAEGVEDRETYDVLTEIGCDKVQGYFVSRPMRYADLLKWIPQW